MLDMHVRPSDLMGIEDAYTAFCFDEACAYIISKMHDGEEPVVKHDGVLGKPKHVSKPSDIYAKYSNQGKG